MECKHCKKCDFEFKTVTSGRVLYTCTICGLWQEQQLEEFARRFFDVLRFLDKFED